MRTHDLAMMAPAYAHGLPELLSLECWGGATFDVSLSFLWEDPWERLRVIRGTHTTKLTITHILSQSFAPVAISMNRDNPRHMIRFPGGGSSARAR